MVSTVTFGVQWKDLPTVLTALHSFFGEVWEGKKRRSQIRGAALVYFGHWCFCKVVRFELVFNLNLYIYMLSVCHET